MADLKSPILGAIADDLTGATDLALTLSDGGMRTVLVAGVPAPDLVVDDADALVVALKSRTIPADAAVDQSLKALAWLQAGGVDLVFFKYCSTFDSTPAGNIGPVADALLDRLDAGFSIVCPAFPAAGRTIYKGYLFVGDVPLSESSMRDHPLTPMTDANLMRLMAAQSRHRVGLTPFVTVAAGAEAIARQWREARESGVTYAVVDALTEENLLEIGLACRDLRLVTGGSGVAMGLPAMLRQSGRLSGAAAQAFDPPAGPAAVLSGSCSAATRAQVTAAAARMPARMIDPLALAADPSALDELVAWAVGATTDGPVLVYSTADPETVRDVQEKLGRDVAATLVENALATLAEHLVSDGGVRRLVVAGGESAGAVIDRLAVGSLRIGPTIAPGVPWTVSDGDPALALALKSGNFGGRDFFHDALRMLP